MVSSSSLDRSKTRDATSIEVRMERDVNALPPTPASGERTRGGARRGRVKHLPCP